jgi:hypothetical protein
MTVQMTVQMTHCRTRGILLSLFVTAFVSVLSNTATGAEIESINGYHLRQLSEEIGPVETLVSGDFCRFDNNANATTFIINSRTNEVTILNHKSKEYWTTPMARFVPALSFINKLQRYADYQDLRPAGTRTSRILSLPTTVEILKNPEKFTSNAVDKRDKLTLISGEIAGCPSISQNRNMARFTSKIFSIPESHAYPLEFTYKNRKGGVHTILRTSLAEKAKVRQESFRPPLDYKKAKNQSEVYLDAAGHDTLEDMLK